MFGRRWEPAAATIVAVHDKRTTGDGMTTIHEYAADVTPESGSPPFRALIQEPRISTNFWSPSVGEVVRVRADVGRSRARFDKRDPTVDARARRRARGTAFDEVLKEQPGSPEF